MTMTNSMQEDGPPKLVGCVVLLLFNLVFGGTSTRYLLNTLLPLVLDPDRAIIFAAHGGAHFWPCAFAGLFVGEITVPLSLLVWILRACGVL